MKKLIYKCQSNSGNGLRQAMKRANIDLGLGVLPVVQDNTRTDQQKNIQIQDNLERDIKTVATSNTKKEKARAASRRTIARHTLGINDPVQEFKDRQDIDSYNSAYNNGIGVYLDDDGSVAEGKNTLRDTFRTLANGANFIGNLATETARAAGSIIAPEFTPFIYSPELYNAGENIHTSLENNNYFNSGLNFALALPLATPAGKFFGTGLFPKIYNKGIRFPGTKLVSTGEIFKSDLYPGQWVAFTGPKNAPNQPSILRIKQELGSPSFIADGTTGYFQLPKEFSEEDVFDFYREWNKLVNPITVNSPLPKSTTQKIVGFTSPETYAQTSRGTGLSGANAGGKEVIRKGQKTFVPKEEVRQRYLSEKTLKKRQGISVFNEDQDLKVKYINEHRGTKPYWKWDSDKKEFVTPPASNYDLKWDNVNNMWIPKDAKWNQQLGRYVKKDGSPGKWSKRLLDWIPE